MTKDEKLIAAVFVLIVALCLGVIYYARNNTYPDALHIKSIDWLRVVHVEAFKVVHKDTYESQMPADAYNIYKYTHTYYESETCTRGSGKNKTTYECGHWETDYMARYDINRWVWDHDLSTSGDKAQELVWPVFVPTNKGDCLGCEREGSRDQNLFSRFYRPDGREVTYVTHNLDDWHRFNYGTSWIVQFNRFEEPYWDTLALEDKR
jgi:hypothetical protein